jgi:sugar phosphate isomerase/epimerase
MNESMYRYMKVGLVHFMAYPESTKDEGRILETISEIACDDYFNAIEITSIENIEIRKQAKKILDTSHMTVAYGAQPILLSKGLNINDTDEEGREKAVSILKEAIDEAYEMGAEGFAFLSGKYDENEKEKAYNALVKSTREICSYAKSKGNIRIVHEIFDFDVDKKSLVGPSDLAARYGREVRADFDNFGLMADLSHIPLLKESVEQSVMPIREYLVHAHMGNCVVRDKKLPGYGDLHPRFGFPESENDVEELIKYLKVLMDIGFLNKVNTPVVSFEIKPFGDEEPRFVIANAKRVLNEAWARL